MQQFLAAITMKKKRIKNLKDKESKDERFIDAGADFCNHNNDFNIFWLGNL